MAQRKKRTSPRARPARKSPAPPSKKTAAPKVLPEGRALPIDIDPKRIEEALGKITSEVKHWANKGRYTKVRLKFRGKPLLPDLPLAAFLAAEGLTFYWGGILRALVVNFAGKSVLSVELISDADKKVQQGKEALLSADVDEAIEKFREAIAMDRDSAAAQLNLGIAFKLKGELAAAKSAFQKARELDPEGPVGEEATRLLEKLPPKAQVVVIQ